MAEEEKKSKEKSGNKIVSVLIVLAIIAIWLVIFGVLIKLDLGGFGSKILYPVLKDVPVINKVLPNVNVDYEEGAGSTKYRTLSQAIEKINELENQLSSFDSTTAANSDYIAQLENEIKNLKVYKDTQDAFEQRVLEFDQQVVFGDEAPSIEEYMNYYAQIEPENAAVIYSQVVQQYQYDSRIKTQAETYGKMEPASAAAILQEMTSGDLDLVVGILSEMSTTKSSAIIAQMDVETAAQITKRMTYVE